MSYNTKLQNNNQELREILEEVNDLPDAGSGEVALPDYWESYLPDKVAAIKAHQDEGGKDCFSFIVMTDIHYHSNLGKRSPAIAKRLLDECNIRYVLSLGDLQNSAPYGTYAETYNEWENIKEMYEPIKENVLYQRGNHDGSWGAALDGVTYPYNFKPEVLYNLIYAKTYKHYNVITDDSGSAYYIDDTTRKVRYILLNTQCNPYEENDNGSAKYSNMKYFRFTQSQYDFVVDALSSLADGWSVLVASHAPINNAYADAFGGDSTTGDHIVMRNLLKAYKEKKAYSAEWAGTAGGGGSSGGYTNLFSTSGSGFKDETSKFYTNWLPYNVADNGGKGTIYHIKGLSHNSGYTNPYKYHFAFDTNGTYGSSTSGSALTYAANYLSDADYDPTVKVVNIGYTNEPVTYIRFEIREALPDNLIITANEDIVEASGSAETGYDAVSVNADFTDAKGEFVAYFSGHMHRDYVYAASDGWGIDIITTACDGDMDTAVTDREAGTVSEQSFDVFTVNKAKRKIYATKIGYGADREIGY